MIYIYSHKNNIINYWIKEFSEEFIVKKVEKDFYSKMGNVNKNDILIVDVDSFQTIDELLLYIKTTHNILNVIALVNIPKLAHGTLMIKKGCKSYIGKETSKIILREVLKTVVEGNVWLYPELMNYIIKNMTVDTEKNQDSKALSILSAKELEVANLVSEGNSNKEISQQLDIQLVTVKKHVSKIFEKLKVKDRVSLAIFINKHKK